MSNEHENLNPNPQQADAGPVPDSASPASAPPDGPEPSQGGVAVQDPVLESTPLDQAAAAELTEPAPADVPPAQTQAEPAIQEQAAAPVPPPVAPPQPGAQQAPPQMPPQQYAPGQQQMPPPEPPAPKKKGGKGIIAAIVAACLVIVAVAGVFLFNKKDGGDSAGIVVDPNMAPEEYVVAALEKTAEEVVLATSFLPDFQKFFGKPTSHEFNLKLDLMALMGPYSPVSEASISGLLQMDNEQQQMLLELSLMMGSLGNYENNLVYISPDLMAVSIPAVFPRTITIDPATFLEDYQNSIFYDPYTDLESLKGLDFFQMARMSDTLQADMLQLFEDFQNRALVEDDKPRDRMAPRTMTFTYSADSVKEFYISVLESYRSYMIAMYTMMDYGYYSYSPLSAEQEVDELIAEMRKLVFPDDVVIHYVVTSEGIVEDIDVRPFRIGYEGETTYITIDAKGAMSSQPGVSSGMDLTINLRDPDDDAYRVRITRDSRNEQGSITDKITVSLLEDFQYGDDITMSYSLDWTPDMTSGGNMKLKLRMDDGYSGIGIDVVGDLTETDDALILDDATITVMEDDYDLFSLDFDYAVRIIEDGISFSPTDGISFFDLTMEDFYSMMGSAMSAMS